MSVVMDRIGRSFKFESIRFRMDEALLEQAATATMDATSARGQLVFDRYCALHLLKYRRNFEPGHFRQGRLLERFRPLYESAQPAIKVTIQVTSGPLFELYVGQPPEAIEEAIRRDPRSWLSSAEVLVADA